MMNLVNLHFTPLLYPNLEVNSNTLYFLGLPERELTFELASILKLCTGTNTIEEIIYAVNDELNYYVFEVLEDLGYVVFPQKFQVHTKVAEPSSVLIISTHMDDAFLSLGGSILSWNHRKKTHVINVFGQDPWHSLHSKFQAPEKQQNDWRQREERFNARLCNCTIEFWDYVGSHSRGNAQWNGAVDWEKEQLLYNDVFSDIQKHIATHQYETVFFPLGVGGHTDHRLVSSVAEALIAENQCASSIYLYEDLPYATKEIHWECWQNFTQFNKSIRIESKYLDISKQIRKKMNLLQTYSSQLMFYEATDIQYYQQSKNMFTGIRSIDQIHHERLGELSEYVERVWTPASNA